MHACCRRPDASITAELGGLWVGAGPSSGDPGVDCCALGCRASERPGVPRKPVGRTRQNPTHVGPFSRKDERARLSAAFTLLGSGRGDKNEPARIVILSGLARFPHQSRSGSGETELKSGVSPGVPMKTCFSPELERREGDLMIDPENGFSVSRERVAPRHAGKRVRA